MNLSPGTRLGPYEILSPLGAGGMGEVYRARDTRLEREVAVKVLPRHLSDNPEIRARFEREAKTVSGLKHPHICVLFDVGREAGIDYLVMELVEGETLADRLARGPLSLGDVVRIGSQIAEALEQAHRAGVVHRDLKPGNVMLTRSGTKLMDFGLARPTGMSGSGVSVVELAQSPTVAQPLTAEGTIVGTFQYMAPEQLEGKEADARVDVWALGCVLHEMVTGERPFEGTSQASLISSIMGSQPAPVSRSAPLVPPELDRLVLACLAKDPDERIQSAHDVRLQLSWVSEAASNPEAAATSAQAHRGQRVFPWVVAGVAVLAAAAAILLGPRREPAGAPVHAYLQPPPGVLFSSSIDRPLPLAISPDGTIIAFCARDGEGPDLLWVRSLAAEDARPLPGTEGAQGPFFSPDGASIGFFAGQDLKRISVEGGPVITLAEKIDPRGGTWNADGTILFTPLSTGPVSMIPAGGGPPADATALDSTVSEATHRYPHFLPDGKHFLYLARRSGAGKGESPTIYVQELGSNERKSVLEVASNVAYASGHLIYVQGTVLMAHRFDLSSLSLTGAAVPLVDDVRMDERFSRGVFAASANGILVCMTGNDLTRMQLRWLDRSGRILAEVGEPADYTYGGVPNISPDGRSGVVPIANKDRGVSEVWVVDLETGRKRKLTVDTRDHPGARWLPDGESVAVTTFAEVGGGIDRVHFNGSFSQIVPGAGFLWPQSAWGDHLLFAPESENAGWGSDIHVISLRGEAPPLPVVASRAFEDHGQFSPDGTLIAYSSDETGRTEIFVAAFPQPGGRWQVSQGGGTEPRWNRNGRELFYVDKDNYIVSVEVADSPAGFEIGAMRKLFQFHGAGGPWRYDVGPAGDRFLVTAPLDKNLRSPVTLITDWTRKTAGR